MKSSLLRINVYQIFCLIIIVVCMSNSYAAFFPAFHLEKNFHPENTVQVDMELNKRCEIQSNIDGQPILEIYWLNNGKHKEPLSDFAMNEIHARLKLHALSSDKRGLKIQLKNLNELNHNLPDGIIEIETLLTEKRCKINARLDLGEGHLMFLETIYSELSLFLNVPTGLHAVVLKGKNVIDGKTINYRMNVK